MNEPQPEPEYVDEDFERFRRERLAKKTTTAPDPAPPVDPAEPDEGYLDDGFAAFRTARLERASEEPEAPENGMFFGTSSNQRRRIRANESDARESRKMSRAEVRRATARTRRQPPPPLPQRGADPSPPLRPRDEDRSPPHGTDLRRKTRRPRRAS